MKRIIKIQTKKIVSHKNNGEPIIEKSLVKLLDHPEYLKLDNNSSFAKFVKYINANRYKETPLIVAVIDNKTGKELNKEDYQSIIDEMVTNGKSVKKIDYKKVAENQAIEIENLKSDFEARLKKLEEKKPSNLQPTKLPEGARDVDVMEALRINQRAIIEQKANDLNITFRKNIGNVKLLEKIIKVEPEFKVNE